MYKLKFVQENVTHEILWYFEIRTDQLISARRLGLVIINKKKKILPSNGICRSGDHRVKIKFKRLEPCQRTKKATEYESDSDTNSSWCTWNGFQSLAKGIGRIGNQKKNRTIQFTRLLRTAGILRRVLETWEDLLTLGLTLGWKTLKVCKIMMLSELPKWQSVVPSVLLRIRHFSFDFNQTFGKM